MCADYGHFADEIDNLENAGVTSFHIDIMDGIFVPNFALSWGQVAYCRTHTKLPLEAHLMVENIDPHINPEFPSRFRFYTESEPLPTSLISVSCS